MFLEAEVADLRFERRPQFAVAEDDELGIGHGAAHPGHGLDEELLALVRHERGHVHEHRRSVREPELLAQVGGGDVVHALHVDAVVYDGDPRARDAVGGQDVGNRL